jgi:hypothetical protein
VGEKEQMVDSRKSNSGHGGFLEELPVTGSVQLRTFKWVMFKLGVMEKSAFVVDLFVPKGTPTREMWHL